MIFIVPKIIVVNLLIIAFALAGQFAAVLPSTAQIERRVTSDSVLMLISEGEKFTLEFNGIARQLVVTKLFGETDVEFVWKSAAFAAEQISGRYVGTREQIMEKMLAKADFIIAYDMTGSEPRISRVVIRASNLGSSNDGVLQTKTEPMIAVERETSDLPNVGTLQGYGNGASESPEAVKSRAHVRQRKLREELSMRALRELESGKSLKERVRERQRRNRRTSAE